MLTSPKPPAPKRKPRISLWSVVAKLPPPRTVAARAPKPQITSIWKAQRVATPLPRPRANAARLRSVFRPRKPL